jgi:hypothetical protein
MQKNKFLFNSVGFVVLFICISLIAYLYISSEKYFYFWDYANYSDKVNHLVEKWQISPLKVIEKVVDSLGDNYTDLPSLLILPFRLFFGGSRLVFILSLSLVYLLPFSLMMGHVATLLIVAPKRLVFWSTAFISILIPTVWVPILRGYPDIGSIVLIAIALTIYWKDYRLKKTKSIIAIAALMSIAVFFRRHFAYGFRAFVLALILDTCWTYLKTHKKYSYKNLFGIAFIRAKRIIVLIVVFLIFSPILVFKTLFIDYRTLYSSYEVSLTENFIYYGEAYGWLIWLLATLGFLLGFRTKILNLRQAKFLILFGFCSITQWIFFSRQLGVHYTTHFSIFIVLGISTLFWSIGTIRQQINSWIILTLHSLILSINFCLGLTFIDQKYFPARPMFAVNEPPLVRQDYETFVRLLKYLDKINSEKKQIYVGASSWSFNSSIIKSGGSYLRPPIQLPVVGTSDIDSRDVYPLYRLLKAHYVVIATPFQHHLVPSEQQVVQVVMDTFDQNWRFAQDFKLLPLEFHLDNKITIKIYERARPASVNTILETLEQFRKRVVRKPGQETYWLALASEQGTEISKDPIFDKTNIFPISVNPQKSVPLLYFGKIPQTFKLEGKISLPQCNNLNTIEMRWTFLNQMGQAIASQKMIQSLENNHNFSLLSSRQGASYLRLDLRGNPEQFQANNCMISLNNIQIKELP